MTRSLYTVPAMLCLAAAVVTAQAPAAEKPAGNPPAAQEPATPKPATPPASSASAANKVTYSGCVKPGTGTDTWILENAEASAKPGASSSTVGTSGTSKVTLDLQPAAAASVNLKPHANHKVEVTGSIAPAKPAAAPGAAARQEFTVESVKMVSATCP